VQRKKAKLSSVSAGGKPPGGKSVKRKRRGDDRPGSGKDVEKGGGEECPSRTSCHKDPNRGTPAEGGLKEWGQLKTCPWETTCKHAQVKKAK